MTQIEELRAKLEREEEILNRVRPELTELKIAIGPWLRAQASGIPMEEPVEARRRYADLQIEIWAARDHLETARQLGIAENRSRRHAENIAQYDVELARLAALPRHNEARGLRIDEEVLRIQRYRDNDARLLDLLGTPHQQLASDSMKVTA